MKPIYVQDIILASIWLTCDWLKMIARRARLSWYHPKISYFDSFTAYDNWIFYRFKHNKTWQTCYFTICLFAIFFNYPCISRFVFGEVYWIILPRALNKGQDCMGRSSTSIWSHEPVLFLGNAILKNMNWRLANRQRFVVIFWKCL